MDRYVRNGIILRDLKIKTTFSVIKNLKYR